MRRPTVLIDLNALAREEKLYRHRIVAEPGDSDARIKLAWCLFIQSLHQAGRESVLAEHGLPDARPLTTHVDPATVTLASSLLGECLKETHRVCQLSAAAEEREEAERLQAVARLAIGEDPIFQAAFEASDAASQILRALMHSETPPPPQE